MGNELPHMFFDLVRLEVSDDEQMCATSYRCQRLSGSSEDCSKDPEPILIPEPAPSGWWGDGAF